MNTAPALAALNAPVPLPLPAAVTQANSTDSTSSFKSVYQSLPAFHEEDASEDSSRQPTSNAKPIQPKKGLPAIANLVAATAPIVNGGLSKAPLTVVLQSLGTTTRDAAPILEPQEAQVPAPGGKDSKGVAERSPLQLKASVLNGSSQPILPGSTPSNTSSLLEGVTQPVLSTGVATRLVPENVLLPKQPGSKTVPENVLVSKQPRAITVPEIRSAAASDQAAPVTALVILQVPKGVDDAVKLAAVQASSPQAAAGQPASPAPEPVRDLLQPASARGADPVVANAASKGSFVAQAANLAFSLHLAPKEQSPSQPQATAQSAPTRATAAVNTEQAPIAGEALQANQALTADQAFNAKQGSPDTVPLSATRVLSSVSHGDPLSPAALVPRTEALPSSLRLPVSEVPTRHTQAAAQPPATRDQSFGDSRNPSRTPIPNNEAAGSKQVSTASELPAASSPSSHSAWDSTAPIIEFRPTVFTGESAQPIHDPPATALREVQPLLPETPKANPSGEILLHLGGQDQASAAVRLVDRGGAINVTVHASDQGLRNSLRSNLGELATQLNGQGWKADVVKAGSAEASSQNQQDSGSQGQRSSSQQQNHSNSNPSNSNPSNSNSDRQSQRDRRADNRWLEELDEQTAANTAHSGGKN